MKIKKVYKSLLVKVTFLIFLIIFTVYIQLVNDILKTNLLKKKTFNHALEVDFNLKQLELNGYFGKDNNNEKCDIKPGLVFVKTHKTGSTTLTNIVLRWAEKQKLLVGLPPERHWELGGYPNFFRPKLLDPQAEKYEVLCHHQRFQFEEVSKNVPPGSFYFTVIRNPVHQFESGIGFFRDLPFAKWLKNFSRPEMLHEFLKNPENYYDKKTPWSFIAKNYMSFDLGFDNERSDLKYIDWVIEYLEKTINFFLITERMDESLIILKDKLCMDSLDDIKYLRLKVRQDTARYNLTSTLNEKIKNWNYLDYSIYQHFSKKLNREIENYGQERMKTDLISFQKLLNVTEDNCVKLYDKLDMKPWVSRIKLKDDSDKLCNKLSWGEVKFGDYIRKKQIAYSEASLKKNQYTYNHLVMGLKIAQNEVLGDLIR